MQFKITGMKVQSNEVVSDIFEATNDEEALAMFHAVYGPAPQPFTNLLPDYAEAFAVDDV